MLIAEHLIPERVIFARKKRFTEDVYETVLCASHAVSASLLLLWLSGIGFPVLGYLNDPGYLDNQEIWAMESIVFLMSLNGVHIHRRLLPRLLDVSQGGSLMRTAAESASFRLAFYASPGGRLLAAFYGTAKLLNNGYPYAELFGLYLAIVALLFAPSYLVRPDRWEVQPPAAEDAEPSY